MLLVREKLFDGDGVNYIICVHFTYSSVHTKTLIVQKIGKNMNYPATGNCEWSKTAYTRPQQGGSCPKVNHCIYAYKQSRLRSRPDLALLRLRLQI